MTRIPAWRRYLRFWRPDVDADIDDELRFHTEERVEDLMLRGRSREEARAEAAQEFGDVDVVRAGLHEIDTRVQHQRQRAGWLDALAQDLRYAVRSLARARGFSTMVVVTLALGFGVNAAMLGFLEQVFIRPPAGVLAPNQVRRLWTWHTNAPNAVPYAGSFVTYRQYGAMAAAMRPMAQVTATTPFSSVDIGDGRNAQVAWAEASFFPSLGVRPEIGRFYGPSEDVLGAGAHVAVISDAFWRAHFGGDSSIIGRTLKIARDPYTIIGVAQPGFTGVDLDAIDVWIPLGALVMPGGEGKPWYQSDNAYPLSMVLRVLPSTNDRLLAARATTALRRAERQTRFPDTLSFAQLAPISLARGPGDQEQSIKVATRVAAVAFIVLLVACANVTNLFLARAMHRRREIAIRLAVGVSRQRLTAMIALEAVLLSLIGAAAALVASLWGAAAMRRLLSPETHWAGAAVDWRSASWVAALALGAGVLIGIIAAIRAGRDDPGVALKAGAREGTYQRSRLRMTLLAGQAALSVVLLVGAGLFIRSLHEVQSIDIGYDQRKLTFVSASFYGVDRQTQRERYASGFPHLAQELAKVPGVESVARTTTTPLRSFNYNTLSIPGVDSVTLVKRIGPIYAGVSPEFFRTVGMRIVRGRGFTEADRPGSRLVAVVNETMARGVWPHGDALGKCIILGHRNDPCSTVVGVVQDAHSLGLIEKRTKAQYFTSLAQAPDFWVGSTVIVRADPSRAAAVQHEATRLVMAEWPDAYPWAESMAAILEPSYRPWRLGATLFTAFGLLALLVAAVGVHSTLAYTFSQRTHEIGVRMALGARAGDVVRLVVSEGVRVVIGGVAIGIVLALMLGRFVASLLYGVSAHDPVTLVGTAVVLVGIAALAALIPARRATRVDPAVALNADW